MIHREDVDDVAVLRMEHGKANTLDIDFFDEFDESLDEVTGSPSARALVLTGTGAIFSAGVDLVQVIQGGQEYGEAFLPRLSSSLRRVFSLPLPVVAAVNGHAIAGGFILALAADHRVMAEGQGKLGLTELLVGVPFPLTALEVVRFQVPGRTVQDLVLSGRTMPGDEALGLRLVDEVVPAETTVTRAVHVASRYGEIPRPAFALTKRQLRAPSLEAIDRFGAEHDPEVLALWSHPDSLQRISRFLEKTVGRKG